MDSILTSVKKIIGLPEEYTQFDTDIILHINTVFGILNQLGVGPKNGFSINDASANWSDYIKNDKNIEMVKTYTSLRVRIFFDPPTNSSLLEALKENINELEWRMMLEMELNKEE